MMKTRFLCVALTVMFAFVSIISFAQDKQDLKETKESSIANHEKLVVVCTSGDRDVALKMVFMYTFNAKKYEWWKEITLLIWGPSSKLLSEDKSN